MMHIPQEDNWCKIAKLRIARVLQKGGIDTIVDAIREGYQRKTALGATETTELLNIFGLKPSDALPTLAKSLGSDFEALEQARSEAIRGRRVHLDSNILTQINAATCKLIDLALRRRPDIAIQYAMLKQTAAQDRLACSNIWPSVSLQLSASTDLQNSESGSYGASNNQHTGGFGRIDTFFASVNVSFTLFDGFNLINKYNAANQSLWVSNASLATTELGIISDVVTSIVNYNYSVDLYFKASDASGAAATALETTQKAGTNASSYLDAINAQTALFTARVLEAQAAVNVLASAYLLCNSTGTALDLLNIPKMHIPTIRDLNTVANKPPKQAALPNHR
jgi:outer membrane protein TolC